MPGFNLMRNARAFFTTNLETGTNKVTATAATAANTVELQVLGGLSFSQATETQAITVSEAGDSPARSQRTFNTALAPVEFSFSTYLRPKGLATPDCEEKVLWNALLSSKAIDLVGTTLTTVAGFTRTASLDTVTFTCTAFNFGAIGAVNDVVNLSGIVDTVTSDWNGPVKVTAIAGTAAACTGLTVKYLKAPTGAATSPSTPPASTLKVTAGAVYRNASGTPTGETAFLGFHSGGSNKNQLQAFGMVIAIDDVTYLLDNCALDQATVDFGLDGIAQVAWTGRATALRQVAATAGTGGTLTGGFAGSYTTKVTDASFITNKLSTATLKKSFRGLGSTNTSYNVAITGGSFTIANNINYLTPENLGIVNSPAVYFTGTRAITGTVNAYLKTGSLNTSTLLTDMLADATSVTETKYFLELQIGGNGNNTKVEVEMPAVSLQIPTIDAGGDVLSTSIAFTAQGSDASSSAAAAVTTSAYDVEASNDLYIRYFAAA